MGLISWCNRFIKSGFYLLFGIVPLLLTPWNYELFEYNKMMGVYIVTSFIVTSWVIKMLEQKEFKIAKTPLDIPIVLFLISQLVSSLFSMDPHVSWFGYYSRFNGGMWSVVSYVLLYYAFVSNTDVFGATSSPSDVSGIKYQVSGKKQGKQKAILPILPTTSPIIRLLKTSLFTATIIAAYGVLERLGIDKHIWVQDVQSRVFSTLGQPNWLAAYLVALIPLAMAFGLHHAMTNKPRHWIAATVYAIVSVLFFTVLLFTRSRSGLLGLAVADVVFWAAQPMIRYWLSSLIHASNLARMNTRPATYGVPPDALSLNNQRATIKVAVVVHILFALIIFFNGTYIAQIDKYVTLEGWKSFATTSAPLHQGSAGKAANPTGYTAPALESGGTESGVIREYVWQAALTAWKSTTKTILIGTGTETFAFAFYQFRPVAHNMTSEWDFLYNKAHNEYLNYLATTGVFGLGSYLLFLATFIVWFLRNLKTKNENGKISSTSEIFDMRFALFSGWLSILVTNFFGFSVVILQVFLFLFPAIIFLLTPSTLIHDSKFRLSFPAWARWIPVILGVYLVITIGAFWYADKRFAYGYQYDRAGLYAQGAPAIVAAIAINPNEPLYHDELAGSYAALAVGAYNEKNATQAANLAELALAESNKAIQISPHNVNFLKTRTKVYYTLSTFDPALNAEAITTLQKASLLSPNDPKIYYNLAILYGRAGQNDQAIANLLRAKKLKKDYRDVYNALNIFYTEMGKKADARAVLEEYLANVNPNDTQFMKTLNQ